MDNAVSIERRLAAMKAFHDAGVRTTCFISPIFPGLTDLPSIIHRAKNQCNLVWLENLNLRGGYKKTIFDYITEKHPDLLPLYDTIYNKKERSYWSMLDAQMRQFCQEEGLLYVRDDDSIKRPFNDPPIVVNYFFHEVKCIFKFYLARVNSIPVEFTSAWIFPSSFYKILLQMIPCLCRRRIK
mgnify:CR=1 FL=1